MGRPPTLMALVRICPESDCSPSAGPNTPRNSNDFVKSKGGVGRSFPFEVYCAKRSTSYLAPQIIFCALRHEDLRHIALLQFALLGRLDEHHTVHFGGLAVGAARVDG